MKTNFYEFISEFTYELIYVNTQNINSCIRVLQIWRSGCSRSERWRRLRLLRRRGGESLSQCCGEWRRAAVPSEWAGQRRVTRAAANDAGCGDWRWAAASDYRDGARRMTAGRGEWRRAAASDLGCGEPESVTRAVESDGRRGTGYSGRGKWAGLLSTSDDGPGCDPVSDSAAGHSELHGLSYWLGPWRQSLSDCEWLGPRRVTTGSCDSPASSFGKKALQIRAHATKAV